MSETFSNNLINGTIYHLLNFEKYPSFQQAAKQAAINNNFQIVLFSSDFNVVFSVETRHTVSIEDAVRTRLDNADFDKERKGSRLDVRGLETYWGPIDLAGTRYYLMLADNDKFYTQDEMTKLAEIIELAMGMWNYVPDRDPAAELIRALRRGNRGLAHTLMDELSIKETDFSGVFVIAGARKDEAMQRITAFEADHGLKVIKIADTDEIVGVVLGTSGMRIPDHAAWRKLACELTEFGAKKTFNVMTNSGVEGICGAFQLINKTEAFVQFIFPYRRSFTKFELALAANCVSICMNENDGSIKRNYLDLIRPFSEGSDNKSRQLMETLEVFILDAGLSSSKAAKLMNVHVNTVQYRLKRIREILGADITANTIVPGLMMALAVQRIEKEAGPF
ncbi:MAG: helix-turn-helix domain-containing protein [Firmicutes bacterium]|nr:helix-turn-helix domain-containing protein [Bacillota bacterium]